VRRYRLLVAVAIAIGSVAAVVPVGAAGPGAERAAGTERANPAPAVNPAPGAYPVLTVLPVVAGGTVPQETATLLGDVVYSAVLAIPNLRVVQGGSGTAGAVPPRDPGPATGPVHRRGTGDADPLPARSVPSAGVAASVHPGGDYILEGVLREADGYHLVLTLHDTRRRSVIDSRIVPVTPDDGVTAGIEGWRDDMRILFGTLRDDRLVGQTRFLLDEGNIALAWEYYLAATVRGHPVPATTETTIREGRAAALRDELTPSTPSRLRRGAALPADAPERLTEILLVSPGSDEDELLRRLTAEREERSRRRLETLRREIDDHLRKDDIDAARTLLAAPEARELAATDPGAIHALADAIDRRERELRIAHSRSRLRRDDPRGSARPLEAILAEATAGIGPVPVIGRAPARPPATADPTASPARETTTGPATLLPPAVIDALVHREETLVARDRRYIRRAQIPDPLQPRSVGERWFWSSIGGTGTEDPLQRYLDGGVHLSYGAGLARAAPLVRYLRLHRGIAAYLRPAERSDADLTRIDLLGHLSPGVGTNLFELTLGVTGGLSVLTGTREISRDTPPAGDDTPAAANTDRTVLQVGPTLGFTGEAAVLLPGQRIRIALHLTRRHTLWIPDLYLTPATTVGVRIGWVW